MYFSHARKVAVGFALTLALAVPSQALAADSTSSSSESLGVAVSITLTGLPATLSYGAANAVATTASAPAFGLTATSNNASGWEVTWTASDLAAGGNTIGRANRSIAGADAGVTPGYSDGKAIMGMLAPGSQTNTLTLSVAIPADAPAGAYTGSTTFTATTRP